jgi:ATP-dependent HslUV protease ATP-binding subunit HslU
MERLLEDISFEGPGWPDKRISISATYVRERLKDIVKDQDLSRYIL